MAKTVKDLLLACLNATLILVAACLLLLLLLLSKASALSENFDRQMGRLEPLADSVRATGAEIAALRRELSDLRDPSRRTSPEAIERIAASISGIETRLDGMTQTMTALRHAPEQWIDHSITRVADQAVNGFARLRGCTLADDTRPAQDG